MIQRSRQKKNRKRAPEIVFPGYSRERSPPGLNLDYKTVDERFKLQRFPSHRDSLDQMACSPPSESDPSEVEDAIEKATIEDFIEPPANEDITVESSPKLSDPSEVEDAIEPATIDAAMEQATIEKHIEPPANKDTIIESPPKFSGDDNEKVATIVHRRKYLNADTFKSSTKFAADHNPMESRILQRRCYTPITSEVYCFENYSKTKNHITPYDKA